MKIENLQEITNKYDCPAYVYDAEKMIAQYQKLENAFSSVENLRIHYAVKALSNISVLKLFNNLGSGLDTVSIQEVKLGLKAGVPAEKIIFTPNGVALSEIEEAVDLGVQINIDNLIMLEEFGTLHPDVPVCIRMNPHVMAGGNTNISVGHIDSKFGISIHQLPHILRIVENTCMNINGIHMHTGSDILDIDVFIHAAEILFDVAKNFDNLEFIDFGSGFKVAYNDNDISTDIEELGEKLGSRFEDFCKEYGKDLALAFEPGKFLVSESGYFLARVNGVKQTTSTVFAQVDSGFNHFIRPMFYGSKHEIINVSHPNRKPRFYSVVGYICETDTFANNKLISEISDGDVLAFKNAGAYCFTMSSNYNSRFRPPEILWYNGQSYLIRKREEFDDLVKNQEVIDIKIDQSTLQVKE